MLKNTIGKKMYSCLKKTNPINPINYYYCQLVIYLITREHTSHLTLYDSIKIVISKIGFDKAEKERFCSLPVQSVQPPRDIFHSFEHKHKNTYL